VLLLSITTTATTTTRTTTTTTTLQEGVYVRFRCFFARRFDTVKINLHAENVFSLAKILSVSILTTWKVTDVSRITISSIGSPGIKGPWTVSRMRQRTL